MKQDTDFLDLVCRRVTLLAEPACVKDSELRYVLVNQAYAEMLNETASTFTGRTDNQLGPQFLDSRRDGLERRAVVFGEDSAIDFEANSGAEPYLLRIEQFINDAEEIFVFEHFLPQSAASATNISAPGERSAASPERLFQLQVVSDNDANDGSAPSSNMERADFHALLDHAIANLDAGLLILDPQGRVVYVNETMQDLYSPFMGEIKLGESVVDLLRRGAKNNLSKHLYGMDAEEREAWAQKQIHSFEVPFFDLISETGDGRWIRIINRRLADGYTVALRLDVTEMKQREALLTSQRDEVGLYKAILDALPVPIFARDENHLMTYSNDAGYHIIGKTADELIGKDEIAVFGEDARPFFEENEEILRTGNVSVQERHFPSLDGTPTPVITRISRAELSDGKRYVIGSIMDVSSLKERERELEEARRVAEKAEADLLEIINNADYGVVVIRQDDLTVELANDLVTSQWAMLPVKDIVGRSFIDLLDYNYEHKVFKQTYENHVRSKAIWARQIRQGNVPLREVTSASGVSLLIQGRPLSGGRLLLTYSDITEIRRRDREIDEAKSQLVETGQLMNEALLAIDRGMLVLSSDKVAICNDAVSRLLELPEGIIGVGHDWAMAFAYCTKRGDFGSDPISVFKQLRAAIQKRRFADLTFQVAGNRWIKLEARPARNSTTIMLLTDISEMLNRQTELERLVVDAEKADRAKSEFLANVSQSIRTPMNGVLGMAELLVRSPLDTRQKAFVEAIAKSGKALLTVINDILDFSEIDAERLELRASNFDPLASIEDIVGLMASKAEEKDIELVVRHTAEVPQRVRADAARFRQTVFNLIRNAIKFTEKGYVEIILSSADMIDDEPAISVAIRDTGIGIPQDRLQTIFEKFGRVDGSSKSRNEGIGLGLAIAHGLVQMMGGNIAVESKPGQGSTFTLTVPVEVVEKHDGAFRAADAMPDGRILLVDPGVASRRAITEVLEEWGFEVAAAADGRQGLAILEAASTVDAPIRAAIINSTLADQSGPEMIAAMRSEERFCKLPVILMTKSDFSQTDAFYYADVQAQLPKPIRSSLLKSTLLNVLSGAQGGRFPTRESSETARDAGCEAESRQVALDVLIAEDNEINALMYEQVLSGTCYSFRIVKDGQLAVNAWLKNRPKVIFMDIKMPVMDGLEATSAIRAEEAMIGAKRTPIVAVTSHADEESREACMEAGMDDCLAKPLSPERLIDKVAAWIGMTNTGETEDRSVSQSA